MKKIAFPLVLTFLLTLGLSSCKKCAECSDQDGLFYTGEYCKGNVLEDAVYAAAKEECEAAGGKFR